MRREYYAEYYRIEDRHWWFVGRRNIFLKTLDHFLGDRGAQPRALNILDVGCGTGTMLGYLARYGEAVGVDLDQEAVDYCHDRGMDAVRHVAEAPLPFPDGTFDVVTLLDVLEHADDDLNLLQEIHRVLRPGALLLVSVPAYRFLWGPQDEINLHRRRYTAAQLRRRLLEAGYDVKLLTYFNTLLFPVIAAIRLSRRLLPAPRELKSDFTIASRPGVNSVLSRLFSVEAFGLPHVRYPFGVSLMAVARKSARRPASLRRVAPGSGTELAG